MFPWLTGMGPSLSPTRGGPARAAGPRWSRRSGALQWDSFEHDVTREERGPATLFATAVAAFAVAATAVAAATTVATAALTSPDRR